MKKDLDYVQIEAFERMKSMNLFHNAIEEFINEGKLNKSENGILYWLDDEEQQIVKDFEKEHEGYIVYHVILTKTYDGDLYNLLYVNPDDEEWEYDRMDIANGETLAYVYNKEYPMFSEFGHISIVNRFGGMVRTA